VVIAKEGIGACEPVGETTSVNPDHDGLSVALAVPMLIALSRKLLV